MKKLIAIAVVLAAVVYFVPPVRHRVMAALGAVKEQAQEDVAPEEGRLPGKVFYANGKKYYHATKNCPRAQKQGGRLTTTTVDRVKMVAEPCPDCKPPAD
jgi:hypothetical protein